MLSNQELESALEGIPPAFKQAHRLVRFLSNNPHAITVAVNESCSIGNISDVARRINPLLFRKGLYISCRQPADPVFNQFDEPSQMYEWSLHRIRQDAANDPQGATA